MERNVRLSDRVIDAVKAKGVKVYHADRNLTSVWNRVRMAGEPVQFGGWYWMQESKGRVVLTDTEGPFSSESAAIRDAWKRLQIRA